MFAAQDGATPNDKLYVDDVFSAYTYTGDDASTRVITNGIDLAGNGGMVWIKGRDVRNHAVFDTARGTYARLTSNSTDAQVNPYNFSLKAFNSNGFSIGSAADVNTVPSINYVSWTFRKAAKFFDVVTYTGNGSNRTISHNLGQVPGMIIVKRTDTTGSWMVYHRSLANTENLVLNTTAAKATNATAWNSTTADASVFSLGTHADVNTNAATYVAYLFAHDTGGDGLVQCGSFTVTGSTADVTLGWEPQYVMMKRTDATGEWYIFDTARGWTVPGSNGDNYLWAQSSAAEATSASALGGPTATGFKFENLTSTGTYIYLAIRRPNKPPTVGTQVYNAIARTGTGAAATVTGVGFAPDLVSLHSRSGTTGGRWEDRLRGATIELVPETTAAETTVAQSITSFSMDGFALGTDGDWNTNTATYINHCFKRAPGVFDVVISTAVSSVPHALGVIPEMIITKPRAGSETWYVHTLAGYMVLNTTAAKGSSTSAQGYGATSTTFNTSIFRAAGTETVHYLFATKAGISKCGTYTGNGTTKAVDCGFTTGARFVMIKRTDSTGDWYVWDTVRGIIAGNDPYLLINSTAAEVTSTDYIDPSTAGFELSSTAPAAINANGGSFVFLAFA